MHLRGLRSPDVPRSASNRGPSLMTFSGRWSKLAALPIQSVWTSGGSYACSDVRLPLKGLVFTETVLRITNVSWNADCHPTSLTNFTHHISARDTLLMGNRRRTWQPHQMCASPNRKRRLNSISKYWNKTRGVVPNTVGYLKSCYSRNSFIHY